MSNAIQRSYYEDDVQNATPQRLRLMLIDGAIRFANQAVSLWADDVAAAHHALSRCRKIIIELIASIRGDRASCEYLVDHIVRGTPLSAAEREAEIENLERISRDALSIYLIIFRQLDEAQLSGDSVKIHEAIEVLEEEQQTAQLLCEQLPDAPQVTAPRESNITSHDAEETLQDMQRTAQIAPATYGSNAAQSSSSMSFEA